MIFSLKKVVKIIKVEEWMSKPVISLKPENTVDDTIKLMVKKNIGVVAIVKDEKKTLSAPAWISGEYGYENLYVGVPIILGKDGVEKILEIELSDKEKQEFANAVAHAKTLMEQVKGKY